MGVLGVWKIVISTVGVTRATSETKALEIQMLPSGPAAMELGEFTPLNSVITPLGVILPNLRGDVARERIRCRCRKLRKNAGRGIVPPNGMIGLISKPNIAIRAGGDTHAHPEEGELELSDRASWCDRRNLPCRPFAEPDVAVGARSDESWIAQGRGNEVSKLALGSDAGDLIAIGKSEPKITIRPHRDREGLAASANGEALGSNWCVARRQRLGGRTPYAEREHGEAEGKFRSECVAKGGEYRPG